MAARASAFGAKVKLRARHEIAITSMKQHHVSASGNYAFIAIKIAGHAAKHWTNNCGMETIVNTTTGAAKMQDSIILIHTDHHSGSLSGLLTSIGYFAREFVSPDVFLAAAKSNPNAKCVLVDLQDSRRGLAIQQRALVERISTPFLFIIDQADTDFAVSAVRRGAVSVLERPLSEKQVKEAIDEAAMMSDAYRAFAESGEHQTRLNSLSERERRIVQLAADGTPNKRIASILGLSVKTVEKQRRQAYLHLKVLSTAEMTRAVTLGSLHPLLRQPAEQSIALNTPAS